MIYNFGVKRKRISWSYVGEDGGVLDPLPRGSSPPTPALLTPGLPCPLSPGGGVLPMWWVKHMCRGFDPLFSLWRDRARSFWGTFSHPPTAKLSFGVQKLPIFTKIDLFGPKFNFFLDLFGSNFQRPAAHPHQFSGRVPPPPPRAPELSSPTVTGVALR